jgi:hypothetical protein
LSFWLYGILLSGLAFSVWFATSYSLCVPPATIGINAVFNASGPNALSGSLSESTSSAVQVAGSCPSMSVFNVLRAASLLPSSSEPAEVLQPLYYLRHTKNLTVSVELSGFRRLVGDCATLCHGPQLLLQTTGCVVDNQPCSSLMASVCELVDASTCRISVSLPPGHSLDSSASFTFTLPADVAVNYVTAVVYMPQSAVQTASGAVQTFESWARMVQSPPIGSGLVMRGNVRVRCGCVA